MHVFLGLHSIPSLFLYRYSFLSLSLSLSVCLSFISFLWSIYYCYYHDYDRYYYHECFVSDSTFFSCFGKTFFVVCVCVCKPLGAGRPEWGLNTLETFALPVNFRWRANPVKGQGNGVQKRGGERSFIGPLWPLHVDADESDEMMVTNAFGPTASNVTPIWFLA